MVKMPNRNIVKEKIQFSQFIIVFQLDKKKINKYKANY